MIIWTVYVLRSADGHPLSRNHIRANAVRGRISLRRLTASQIRVARLTDGHAIDLIPPLRGPQIRRWEPEGLLLHGESTADEWRGDWKPQAWWCEPAQSGEWSGGWAKWYRWRRP